MLTGTKAGAGGTDSIAQPLPAPDPAEGPTPPGMGLMEPLADPRVRGLGNLGELGPKVRSVLRPEWLTLLRASRQARSCGCDTGSDIPGGGAA